MNCELISSIRGGWKNQINNNKKSSREWNIEENYKRLSIKQSTLHRLRCVWINFCLERKSSLSLEVMKVIYFVLCLYFFFRRFHQSRARVDCENLFTQFFSFEHDHFSLFFPWDTRCPLKNCSARCNVNNKKKKIVLVRELNFVISILDYTWSMRWRNHPTISALSTRLTRWCIPVGERFSRVTWLLFWCVLCWVCWVQHNTQPTGSSSSRWFMEIQTLELWVCAQVCATW